MSACPILTYHSQLLFGNEYSNNSHVGLATDLEVIAAAGKRIVPLHRLIDGLTGVAAPLELDQLVCITFDDGCDFDWLDIDHPEHGMQPAFASVLRAFASRRPEQGVHATSFVLADPQARARISRHDLGHDWMNDDWWAQAEASGLVAIESHGLDHRHPSLAPEDDGFGHYHAIADEASCRAQIDQASDLIAARSGRRPSIFAYPYGQASDYLRREYLPRYESRHGIRAAVSTQPEHFHWQVERWFIPRYVSLQHWKSPEDLARLIA